MRIIAKLVWTKPVQPPKPSLHFKFPLSRETHTDVSELSLNHQEQPNKELAIDLHATPVVVKNLRTNRKVWEKLREV